MTAEIQTVKFNQTQYRISWVIQHHLYERQQFSNFKYALDQQTNNVKQFILSHGINNLSQYLTVLITPQPIATAYQKCYQRVGVQHAEWTYSKINSLANKKEAQAIELKTQKSLPSFFSEQWRKLMSLFYQTDGGKRITQVTETTRENVMQLLDDSQSLPMSERATYMVDQLNDPDFNRMRALRIARTESTTAANKGALLGAESSDYLTAKLWIAVMDANTRPAHADANGEQVLMDDTFDVGGEDLSFPGDPAGSAGNIINCRCSLAIVPLMGDNGLPVLKVA